MALLEIADLEFGYSNEPLFTKVTFRLEAGERAALVAPNGAGKSTLLRVIAGELQADKGSVLLKKPATVGYYRQSHEARSEGTVLDALMSGFSELIDVRRELSLAQHAAETGAPADLDRLANALDRYHQSGADRLEQRVQSIATRLGFADRELSRLVSTLSGGERGRLALGVVLATTPDLLLLDEPTNHLDLESIRWLESYLREQRAAVLVVSHDRAFLDAVCPTTMELGRTTFRVYPLPYTAYHEERREDLEREQKLAEEQAAFVAKTEDFIRKNIAGQKTKQAQSRRRMLDKLERVGRPEDVWARAERVRFRFAEAPRSGDIVLEAKGLAAERGGNRLFAGVDLLVRRGDRIGIVGANGSGKSTLMGLLAGRGHEADEGAVRRGTNLYEGYFDQHLGSLDPARTGIDEIRSVRGDLNSDGARQYLARFRFYGDDPLRKVESLSGGERTRLALGKLLLEPRNLLFLDEPTNHLDIPAAEILEEALVGFEGTVILVSHDRRFLETVTTRTLAFTEHGVDVYEGGFKDYTDALERQRKAALEPAPKKPKTPSTPVKPEPAAGADAYRAQKAAARDLERKRKRVQELETHISEGERETQRYRSELKEVPSTDWERLHALAKKEQELTRRLERWTAEWVKLSEELET
ncbi:MAG TPA: ATP-binding cassette domain-containing protein [Polyangiaceae bacterium]|nr:ATP-binding cassette domain-containing protein [Polyangiaceae bacterium]